MRTSTLFVLSLALFSAVDLPGQGRGRRGRRSQPTTPPPPAAAPKKEEKPKEPKQHTAIVGGDVYIGTGQRLTGATVLIADDKIDKVGHNLSLPDDTTIIDAKGKTISPGFCIVEGSGMGAGFRGPFKDTVNPFAPDIKQGLAAGITSFLVGSTSSRGKVGGSNAVIKLAYGDVEGMVLKENSVVGISVPLKRADRENLEKSVQAANDYIADYDPEAVDEPAADEDAATASDDDEEGVDAAISSAEISAYRAAAKEALRRRDEAATTVAPPSKHRGEFEVVVGVVGKPSAGKSTFFNAVTRATGAIAAKVAAYPFTTIDPNVREGLYGVLDPDPALALGRPLSACPPHGRYAQRRRLLPVLLKDVAGLVPGAYAGKGKGNRFLNDLCDADALVYVCVEIKQCVDGVEVDATIQ